MLSLAQLALFSLVVSSSLAAPLRPPVHKGATLHRRCNGQTPSNTTKHHPAPVVPSPTSSSPLPSATPATLSPNKLSVLFPISITNAISSWSTSDLVPNPKPLDDSTFNIYRGKNTVHPYTNAPDGTLSMEAIFNKGSVSPGHTPTSGGFTLYSLGPTDLSKGTEVTFSYSAYFEQGFEFNLGGKMPGLYGGINNEVATQCSGGNHNPACWSTRLMWRENGLGELYAYLPQIPSNTVAFANTPPKTVSNEAYGDSVGRGAFTWATGEWTRVAQRVKLNDIGSANGEIEVYANGQSVIKVSGLTFRTDPNSLVRGAQIQTFFGGHTAIWASPKTQRAYFKDFSAAVIA